MLKQTTEDYLRGLTYEPTAERYSMFMPLGTIYWSDEIPDMKALSELPDEGHEQVFRLMNIRAQLWNDEFLRVDDQVLWDDAQAKVPLCPLFQRLSLSKEDRDAQAEAEDSTREFIEHLATTADEFTLDEDGNMSAKFDLTKGHRQPAWRRWVSWISGKWS